MLNAYMRFFLLMFLLPKPNAPGWISIAFREESQLPRSEIARAETHSQGTQVEAQRGILTSRPLPPSHQHARSKNLKAVLDECK
jgi:hypothetical protein